MTSSIYKISPASAWRAAEIAGVFTGAPVDIADGFIHFSSADQVRETAARHFGGQRDLVLAAISTAALGDVLVWEASRGGALFPHLYAPLPMSAVTGVHDMPLDAEGHHIFPAEIPCKGDPA
jgi:uncharacterized protein (DUF952 family)